MAVDQRYEPFLRKLVSENRTDRADAIRYIRAFLPASESLKPTDHAKLWQGLYYGMWKCDRPTTQQDLSAKLAGLVEVVPDAAVGRWLSGFWETMGRQWTSIDALRMDKFLLLVRRVLAAGLAWVVAALPTPADDENNGKPESKTRRKKGVGRERIEALLENFAQWPLDTEDDLSRVPVGLRLHILDIWVDEAERVGLLDVEKTGEAGRQFLDRLGLLVEAVARSTCKPVRLRAKESLEDDRLPWNRDEKGDNEVGKTVKSDWDGFVD